MDVVPVDTRTSDGRRVVGKWVYGVGVPRDQADTAIYFVHGSGYALCSPRTHRRLTSWLPDRTAGVQCRLSAGTTPSIPQRRRRCPIRLGLAHP
jgi:acetyl esterase/lipase